MSTTSSKRKAAVGRNATAMTAHVVHWRDDVPREQVGAGERLSVESPEPFTLHFGHDGWQKVTDLDSQPLASGWHAAELDLKRLGVTQSLEFTRRFRDPRGWEQHDWHIRLGHAGGAR